MTADKVFTPPLKIQGIKTKLVPLIRENVILDQHTTWIEPFMGSGVVGFNVAPQNAIFADTNPHIINFYNQIKSGKITPHSVRFFLQEEGEKLAKYDGEYYNFVRDRFNHDHEALDFLFLNRSCFNGMMRFNKNNEFNVPYGHKPQRFSKAYITKIVNQVSYIETKIHNNNWTFLCQSFEKTLAMADTNSFVYCDPPYIGRNVDYYDTWNENAEILLCELLKNCHTKFMLSTWDHNDYRKNEHLEQTWFFCYKITQSHYYHIGAKESNRNPIIEALLTNYAPQNGNNKTIVTNEQLDLFSFYDHQTI